jgi:hypothetical protein
MTFPAMLSILCSKNIPLVAINSAKQAIPSVPPPSYWEASLLALPVSVIAIAEDSDSDATETETDCRLRNKLAYFSLRLAYFSLQLASVSQYFKKRQLLIDP